MPRTTPSVSTNSTSPLGLPDFSSIVYQNPTSDPSAAAVNVYKDAMRMKSERIKSPGEGYRSLAQPWRLRSERREAWTDGGSEDFVAYPQDSAGSLLTDISSSVGPRRRDVPTSASNIVGVASEPSAPARRCG